MGERGQYEQGVPSWVDLGTSDPEGARAFYGALFGWDWEIEADPQYGEYAQAKVRGKRVAGVGGLQDENMPVVWTTYIAVDDVDKVGQAVAEHGGSLVMPPMAVGDNGRMAIASDPTGAFFGMWEAGTHKGAELVNEHGTVSWNEVITPDLDAATRFYSAVLGVGWTDFGGPDMPYKTVNVGGRNVAGAMPPQPGMGDVPPHWNVYFAVDDVKAAADRVGELGGQVFGDVVPTPQGPMVVASDPQGGMFYMIQLDSPDP